jgi:hypothetical protein
MLGAAQVIAIDNVQERLALARLAGAETINFDEEDATVLEKLKDMTNGNGPDKCIDAVGAESHATASFDAIVDKAKAAVMLGTDRPHVLRAAIMACRPGGIVSVPGVFGGFLDKIPFGAAMNKGLTIRTGQTHVNRYSMDCFDGSKTGRSTRLSLSPIERSRRTALASTRRSGTRKTAASRSYLRLRAMDDRHSAAIFQRVSRPREIPISASVREDPAEAAKCNHNVRQGKQDYAQIHHRSINRH